MDGDGVLTALALLVADGKVQNPPGFEEAGAVTQDVGVEGCDL